MCLCGGVLMGREGEQGNEGKGIWMIDSIYEIDQ
jgi:hypothetical protein